MLSRRFQRRAIVIAAIALFLAAAAGVTFLRARRAAAPTQAPFSDLLRHLDSGTTRNDWGWPIGVTVSPVILPIVAR